MLFYISINRISALYIFENSDIKKLRLSLFRTANLLQIWQKHVYSYFIYLVRTASDELLKSTHRTNRDFLFLCAHVLGDHIQQLE